jgi:hypothetical protein
MTQNTITAGDAVAPIAFAGGNDGTLVLQTGAAGSKVNAVSYAADGTPTFLKARGGVAQIQTLQTGAAGSGTVVIPYDDTIPQNTEGDQYMSLAITPINAVSLLEIDVVFHGSVNATNILTVALFQDSNANALAVGYADVYTNGAEVCIGFKHLMSAGTTSATTFKIRAGGTTGTTSFNGVAGTRRFGGVMSSRITIKEYLP